MNDLTMNYDPNFTASGMTAKQEVRVTFGMWNYRATLETEVDGNCMGMSVMDCAIGNIYDDLECDEPASITLSDSNGDTLECQEAFQGEDWLKDMVVAVEIISITPDDDRVKEMATAAEIVSSLTEEV